MSTWFIATLIGCSALAGQYSSDGIEERDLGLQPDELVQEYVERDANGDFLQTNEWWNIAVACPDCMGGPDTFTVISRYRIQKIGPLDYEVTYQVEGTLSPGSFKPSKKKEADKFTVVKTPWGFKLNDKAFQMVRADVALKKYGNALDENSRRTLKSIKVAIPIE